MRIEAAFDSLTITSLLEKIDLGPTRGEIHLLAYLASLLSVYGRKGEGASDWGYAFTATPGGAPFSESLEVEIERLISKGAYAVVGAALQLTPEGNQLQQTLSGLELVKDRFDYIDSASATVYVLPIGMIRAAFAQDPDISLVAEHRRTRVLASENALARLYAEFDAVADVLGEARGSSFAASVLWLTYLAERGLGTSE